MLRAFSIARVQCRYYRFTPRRSSQLHSTRSIDNFTAEEIEAASRDPVFPIVSSEDGTHALRKRQGGRKPLPLPPHMDPIRRAQRNRWKNPKAKPLKYEEMSQFQKELWENPYGETYTAAKARRTRLILDVLARALATPIRACVATHARLPAFFLLPFELKDNDLATKGSKSAAKHSLVPERLLNEAAGAPSRPSSRQKSVLAREKMLDFLSHSYNTKNTWAYQIFVITDPEWRSVEGDVWDPETPRRIVEAMRTNVINNLQPHLAPSDASLIVPYIDGHVVEQNVACILVFSAPLPTQSDVGAEFTETDDLDHSTPPEVDHDVSQGGQYDDLAVQVQAMVDKSHAGIKKEISRVSPTRGSSKLPRGATTTVEVPQSSIETRYPPLRFPAMRIGDDITPVYDLQSLLGSERLAELLDGTLFKHDAAVVLHSASTVDLEMALLKLQFCLAQPR